MAEINLFDAGINTHKDSRKLSPNEFIGFANCEGSSGSAVSIAKPMHSPITTDRVLPTFIEYKNQIVSGSSPYQGYARMHNKLFRSDGNLIELTYGETINGEFVWEELGLPRPNGKILVTVPESELIGGGTAPAQDTVDISFTSDYGSSQANTLYKYNVVQGTNKYTVSKRSGPEDSHGRVRIDCRGFSGTVQLERIEPGGGEAFKTPATHNIFYDCVRDLDDFEGFTTHDTINVFINRLLPKYEIGAKLDWIKGATMRVTPYLGHGGTFTGTAGTSAANKHHIIIDFRAKTVDYSDFEGWNSDSNVVMITQMGHHEDKWDFGRAKVHIWIDDKSAHTTSIIDRTKHSFGYYLQLDVYWDGLEVRECAWRHYSGDADPYRLLATLDETNEGYWRNSCQPTICTQTKLDLKDEGATYDDSYEPSGGGEY